MTCEFCGGKTTRKRVTKHHRLDGKLYIVENVPAQVCPDCGERLFHATTLDAIDAMLRGKHRVKKRLTVDVVSAP
jgi:HTH-type transcriptional regulator/antitoxin MqsA